MMGGGSHGVGGGRRSCEARPHMSVGRICDLGNNINFGKNKAVVTAPNGDQICCFTRDNGGLYVARLKFKRPKPPFGGPA